MCCLTAIDSFARQHFATFFHAKQQKFAKKDESNTPLLCRLHSFFLENDWHLKRHRDRHQYTVGREERLRMAQISVKLSADMVRVTSRGFEPDGIHTEERWVEVSVGLKISQLA